MVVSEYVKGKLRELNFRLEKVNMDLMKVGKEIERIVDDENSKEDLLNKKKKLEVHKEEVLGKIDKHKQE